MVKKQEIMQSFENVNIILDRAKKGLGLKFDYELAEMLGKNASTLATWRKRNTMNLKLLLTVCKDLDWKWLLTGESAKKDYNIVHDKPGEYLKAEYNGEEIIIRIKIEKSKENERNIRFKIED